MRVLAMASANSMVASSSTTLATGLDASHHGRVDHFATQHHLPRQRLAHRSDQALRAPDPRDGPKI
jgi:hypothetical protein